MGFLDMFDNPDIMSSLLGINTAVGSPGAMPTAPVYQAPPNGGMMGEVLNQAPPAPPQSGTGLNVRDQLPPGQPAGPTMAGVGFPPPPAGGAMAAPRPALPPPTSGPPPGWGYGGGSSTAIPTNTGPTPLPPGAPLNIQPVMQPPASTFANGPPTSTNGSLAAALGINRDRIGNAISAGMAGLGRGLTAVGQARPGASGAQMFAAGAGGALEGGTHQTNLQEAQARQAKMDAFLMSSNAFKDWIAARHADNEEELSKAHAAYFGSRAQQLMTGGGSGAWQNTPYGKVISAEIQAQRFAKAGQIVMMKQWTQNGSTPEQQKADLEKLQKDTDAFRSRLYKSAGIDPDKAEKLKNMGSDENNPFDTKGMSIHQFNEQVLMGQWFKDQHGVVRQRTVPPPGSGAPEQQSNASDDYLATQGQAA
jgi:hypothetical protein